MGPGRPHDPACWATLADRFTVVVELGGQIAGFADLDGSHVDRFFVHADHQRHGVGRAMIRAIIDEAGRAGIDRLSADVSITARPFFERYGFAVRAEQRVLIRGVELTNYRMERPSGGPA